MRETETIPMMAQRFKESTRPIEIKNLTSAELGEAVPITASYVGANESGVGNVQMNVQLAETPEPITNAIHATAMTYLVPFTAFSQFNGSEEEAMRRYAGEPSLFTGNVEPFFEKNKWYNSVNETEATLSSDYAREIDTVVTGQRGESGLAKFYQTMGMHTQAENINNSYVQAYNIVQNHRRRARSPQLAERNEFDHRLAEAFWPNSGNSKIVADYDQAVMTGEVTLSGMTGRAYIASEYLNSEATPPKIASEDTTYSATDNFYPTEYGSTITDAGDHYEFSKIWADFSSANPTISLAELAQGELVAKWAQKRAALSGQSAEWIIDLILRGIQPSSAISRLPILVGMSKGIFSMNQRYATDAANLEDSLTNGMVSLNYRCAVPRTKLGGVLITQLECAPEQVWERKKDYFLYTTDVGKMPNALRDHLMIEGGEGVEVVTKDHLDVNHSTPDAILGFQPLNEKWKVNDIRVGGKFYRPASDSTYVEERARIYSNETSDPALNTDHYLVTNLHKKVFADQVSDALEITAVHDFKLRSDIQFGDRLQETDASTDHEAIKELVAE
jgi:hypothetical protein